VKKIAQHIAQPIFSQNEHLTNRLRGGKVHSKYWAISVIFKKLPRVDNRAPKAKIG
jgi:hypothetical protein